jgi:hypothetical protein
MSHFSKVDEDRFYCMALTADKVTEDSLTKRARIYQAITNNTKIKT